MSQRLAKTTITDGNGGGLYLELPFYVMCSLSDVMCFLSFVMCSFSDLSKIESTFRSKWVFNLLSLTALHSKCNIIFRYQTASQPLNVV